MPQTSDNLARDFQLSREDCDAFALGSQQKYARAKAEGFFKDEIQAVTIAGTRGKPDTVVAEDEHPRADTTPETLKKLKALFEGGVTTAGNASGINDGAVALMVASRDAGDKAGAKPIARVISSGVAGVAPRTMGFGPVPAAKKALERAGLELKDMDVIEINEAFAAQVLACVKGLGARLQGQPRQSERRRHRHRPSAGRIGRPHCADRGAPASADGRAVRAGVDVHRRRPGHRHGDRAGVGLPSPGSHVSHGRAPGRGSGDINAASEKSKRRYPRLCGRALILWPSRI